MRSRGLRLLPMCGLVLMFLAGIGGARAGNLQVVLAAGDDAQPVFDNAVAAMAAWLEARGVPAGDIHRLSASPAQAGNWAGLSTLDNLLHSIEDLSVRPGDRCLVFLTSHGERGEGLWLARSQTALHPASLARALAQGCGAAPTVVIVSGCYSRRLCPRRDGQAQPRHYDRRARRPAVLWLPGRAHLYVFRPVPAGGAAEIRELARRFFRDQAMRRPDGARSRRTAIRAAILFRKDRQSEDGLLAARSVRDDDRHFAAAAGDGDGDFAAVAAKEHIGAAVLRAQPAHVQLVEKIRQHRAVEADGAGGGIEAEAEARLRSRRTLWRRPRPAGCRQRDRGSARLACATETRKTARGAGASPYSRRLRTGRGRSAAPRASARSGRGRGRSARCRAARPSRCDRTSGCSARPTPRPCARPSRKTTPGRARCRRPGGHARGSAMPVKQRMPGVGGDDPAGLFVAVERQRVGRQLLAPERRLEFLRAASRPGFRSAAAVAASPKRRGESRGMVSWRRRHSPAPRTARSGPSASRPSA